MPWKNGEIEVESNYIIAKKKKVAYFLLNEQHIIHSVLFQCWYVCFPASPEIYSNLNLTMVLDF